MKWSQKAADLRRDPRYVLHSPLTSPDTAEAEFKEYGSSRATMPRAALSPVRGGWATRPTQAWSFSFVSMPPSASAGTPARSS
jgi:hypothetical protein